MPSALVTGASKGIGRAIALRLATTHDVIGLARSGPALGTLGDEIAAQGGSFRGLEVDLRNPSAIAAALHDVRCDVLVNNAGVLVKKALVDLAPDEWQAMVDVNLSAVFHVTRAVLPGMIARGTGHIINIASITGRTAYAGGSAYSATKHAVLGLSESLMLEVRQNGVRVSCILPGSVATELSPGGSKVDWALRPEDVAECVASIISMPAHALVYSVEVRSSRPAK